MKVVLRRRVAKRKSDLEVLRRREESDAGGDKLLNTVNTLRRDCKPWFLFFLFSQQPSTLSNINGSVRITRGGGHKEGTGWWNALYFYGVGCEGAEQCISLKDYREGEDRQKKRVAGAFAPGVEGHVPPAVAGSATDKSGIILLRNYRFHVSHGLHFCNCMDW